MIVGKQVFYPNKKLGPIKHFFYKKLELLFDSAENINNALHAPPVSFVYCNLEYNYISLMRFIALTFQ